MIKQSFYTYLIAKCKNVSQGIKKEFCNGFDFFIEFREDNKIIIDDDTFNPRLYKLDNNQYNTLLLLCKQAVKKDHSHDFDNY